MKLPWPGLPLPDQGVTQPCSRLKEGMMQTASRVLAQEGLWPRGRGWVSGSHALMHPREGNG